MVGIELGKAVGSEMPISRPKLNRIKRSQMRQVRRMMGKARRHKRRHRRLEIRWKTAKRPLS